MAKDLYHEAVKTALMKEGWKILAEEFEIKPDDALTFFIDLQVEKFIRAEKEKRIILVEVKSFISRSNTYELHSTVGQYLVYRTALEFLELNQEIFLAVPINIFKSLFNRPFLTYLVQKYELNLLPYDPEKEELIT